MSAGQTFSWLMGVWGYGLRVRESFFFRQIIGATRPYDTDATLDDFREAVTTLEEAERAQRRVLGGDHPVTTAIERDLRNARAALRARETPSAFTTV